MVATCYQTMMGSLVQIVVILRKCMSPKMPCYEDLSEDASGSLFCSVFNFNFSNMISILSGCSRAKEIII